MGSTQLALAAWKGYEEVVKILLRWEEVDPDKPDNDGWTPPLHAAKCRYRNAASSLPEGVLKTVLG